MDVSFKPLIPCSRVNTLPMELMLSCILPKLPAKSLFRFKCVSKFFLTEISSPKFNALFSEANHRLLITQGEYKLFRIYELDSPHSPPTLCPYPMPSKLYEIFGMSMVACCESYLLIGVGYTDHEGLILFNPTTRFYRLLPKVYVAKGADYVHFGLCHCLDDEFNDDFKIVRLVQYNKPHTTLREVIVYSLSTNSWKSIELKRTRNQLIADPVLVQNHLLVMIFYDGSRYGRLERIGCFDIKAERWSNDVLLPDNLLTKKCKGVLYHLGALEGQLRISCYHVKKSTYSIWVMKDYGVKESWVKLLSLPGESPNDVYHPIAYRQGSSDELLCIPNYSGKYYWYNLRDKQFIETGFDGEGLYRTKYSFAYVCRESLLNFPGGKPIRSTSKKQVDDDYYDYYYDYDDNDDDDDDKEDYRFLRLSLNSIRDYDYDYDDDDSYDDEEDSYDDDDDDDDDDDSYDDDDSRYD